MPSAVGGLGKVRAHAERTDRPFDKGPAMREKRSAGASVRVRCGGRAGAHTHRAERSQLGVRVDPLVEQRARRRAPPPPSKRSFCTPTTCARRIRTAQNPVSRKGPPPRISQANISRTRGFMRASREIHFNMVVRGVGVCLGITEQACGLVHEGPAAPCRERGRWWGEGIAGGSAPSISEFAPAYE